MMIATYLATVVVIFCCVYVLFIAPQHALAGFLPSSKRTLPPVHPTNGLQRTDKKPNTLEEVKPTPPTKPIPNPSPNPSNQNPNSNASPVKPVPTPPG